MKRLILVSLTLALTASGSFAAEPLKSLSDFQPAAEKAKETLTIPDWPQTPIAVQGNINTAIAQGTPRSTRSENRI